MPLESAPLHIITGEYPPQAGGVADYSALLAANLAAIGVDVHVWTSSPDDSEFVETPGVETHRIGGSWSGSDLQRLNSALDAFAGPRRLLVQYTPNVWGKRGLNIGFCRWLKSRSERGDDVRPMFHELWYEFDRRDKPTRWIFPVVQRLMVREVMTGSVMAYVSIPTWGEWLKPSRIGRGKPSHWLPVPSNIPVVDAPEAVAEIRKKLAPGGAPILGSFGTFHGEIGDMLAGALAKIQTEAAVVLIGRGSIPFSNRLRSLHPVHATGSLSARETSLHLQAVDLLIQPYPDGITSRRGSAMAGLSHGVPIATSDGYLSEPIWKETQAVAIAPTGDEAALAAIADTLLNNSETRRKLGEAGRSLYDERFAITCTIADLSRSYDS